MLNKVIMMGRLVADPELRRTTSNIPVGSFRIAVDRDYSKEKTTDFFDCVAWRSTGEFVSKYFRKGDMIALEGRLQTRDWQDRDGNKRRAYEIQVDSAHFCGSKKESGKAAEPAKLQDLDDDDGDLPFDLEDDEGLPM